MEEILSCFKRSVLSPLFFRKSNEGNSLPESGASSPKEADFKKSVLFPLFFCKSNGENSLLETRGQHL